MRRFVALLLSTGTLATGCSAGIKSQRAPLCAVGVDSAVVAIVPDSTLPPGVLAGTVKAVADTSPLGYAGVYVTHEIGVIADADGSFRFDGLSTDIVRVRVRLIGYHELVASSRMPSSSGGRTSLYLRENWCPIPHFPL